MDMENLREILTAFEQTLELERELGTRTVECDRALLMSAGVCASPRAAAAEDGRPSVSPQRVERLPREDAQPRQAAREDTRPAAKRDVDFLFIGETFSPGEAKEMFANMVAGMGYAMADVCVSDVRAAPPASALSRVRPKCVVLLGKAAIQGAFPGKVVRRNTWYEWQGVPAIAVLHPNEILRCGADGVRLAKMEVWKTLKLALARLGKTPPPVKQKG